MAEINPSTVTKTKKSRWVLWGALIAVVVLLLAAVVVLFKNRSVHSRVLIPFWQPTITLTSTKTWTPSATYTPSIMPTPTITPTPTPPVIGLDFAPNLSQLAVLEGMDTFTGGWGNRFNYSMSYYGQSFSPGGRYVAFASHEGVQVWDLKDGKLVQKWEIYATHPVFSSDGDNLILEYHCSLSSCASSTEQSKVWILGITDGELKWEFKPEPSTYGLYYNIFLSNDGRYAAIDGNIFQILDLESREIVFKIPSNFGFVSCVAFYSSNSLFAVAGDSGTIRVFQLGNNAVITAFNVDANRVRDLVFSADGSMLAAISSAGKTFVWRTSDWQLLTSDIPVYDTLVRVDFTPDSRVLLVTTFESNEINFIETTTWKVVATFQQTERISDITFGLDGKQLAVVTTDGLLRVWRLDYEPYAGSGDWEIAEYLIREFPGGHTERVFSTAFSPDSSMLASGSADLTVKIWRTADWITKFTLVGHFLPIETVAFSPDGRLLASGADDTMICIWNAQTGSLVNVLLGHENSIFALAFSPDGSLLASGSADRTVKIWRVSDWSLVTTLDGPNDSVWSVAFSPDGTLLGSASGDGYLRTWRVSDWEMLDQFGEGGSYAGAVAFSPDQTIIARGGWDGQVRLYDVETTELLRPLTDPEMQKENWWEHTSRIWSITFSPDSSLMVAASLDRKVRVWRVSDGELLQVLECDADVYSVAVSRNGWWLAAASGVDVTIWGLPRWEQVAAATQAAVLTPQPTFTLTPTP